MAWLPPDWPTPKPVIKKPSRCPLCGSIGVKLFNMFDCSNWACRNYQKPKTQ